MNKLNHTVHKLEALLSTSLDLLPLRIEGKCLKRIALNLIALVLGVLLADAIVHQLPNAIAGFIYGTHQTDIPQKFKSDQLR
jgi:hypothetical protein